MREPTKAAKAPGEVRLTGQDPAPPSPGKRHTAEEWARLGELEDGVEVLSVAGLTARFAALGYRLDRRLDCRSFARVMGGPRAGDSFPAYTTGVTEADTGISAFHHTAARRDDNFRAMQRLRIYACAISEGFVLQP